MLRQPIQRFQQMQASDIDIYRNELRKTNAEIVRLTPTFRPLSDRLTDIFAQGACLWSRASRTVSMLCQAASLRVNPSLAAVAS